MEVPMWQVHHSTIFQTNEVKWSDVYRSWTLLFAREGWTDEDVCEAVIRMAGRTELPRFPPDHLQALRSELHNMVRQERERRAVAFAGLECKTCGGTGWVLNLPHLDQVVSGRWVPGLGDTHKTVAVTCTCPVGRSKKDGVRAHWSRDPLREGSVPMDLDEYTLKNPTHAEQVELWEQAKAAYRQTVKSSATATVVSMEQVREAIRKLAAKRS